MILLVSCATKAITGTFDDTYGYSEKNPIKVGEHSPANSNRYLSSLTGPNDEEVAFGRVGSCCSFKTKMHYLVIVDCWINIGLLMRERRILFIYM